MIKQLKVYSKNSKSVFRGIDRRFFPKCACWSMLEDGAPQEALEEVVHDFYKGFFYYPLRLDLVDDKNITFACLNFATAEGKKKLISKLQKVVGNTAEGVQLIEAFNHTGTEGKYRLLLEMLEHYEYFGTIKDNLWVLSIYRDL